MLKWGGPHAPPPSQQPQNISAFVSSLTTPTSYGASAVESPTRGLPAMTIRQSAPSSRPVLERLCAPRYICDWQTRPFRSPGNKQATQGNSRAETYPVRSCDRHQSSRYVHTKQRKARLAFADHMNRLVAGRLWALTKSPVMNENVRLTRHSAFDGPVIPGSMARATGPSLVRLENAAQRSLCSDRSVAKLIP